MELQLCPYDKHHVVRATRFQVHLAKCRRQHPDIVLIRCIFNATHLVKPEDRQYHLENECRDATNFPSFLKILQTARENQGEMEMQLLRMREEDERAGAEEQIAQTMTTLTAELPPEALQDDTIEMIKAVTEKVANWLQQTAYHFEDDRGGCEPVVINNDPYLLPPGYNPVELEVGKEIRAILMPNIISTDENKLVEPVVNNATSNLRNWAAFVSKAQQLGSPTAVVNEECEVTSEMGESTIDFDDSVSNIGAKNPTLSPTVQWSRDFRAQRCPPPLRNAAYFQAKNQGRSSFGKAEPVVVMKELSKESFSKSSGPLASESVVSVPLGPSSDVASVVSQSAVKRLMRKLAGLESSPNHSQNYVSGSSPKETFASESVVSVPLGPSSDVASVVSQSAVKRLMRKLAGLESSPNHSQNYVSGSSPKETFASESVVSVPLGPSSDVGSVVSQSAVRRLMREMAGLNPPTNRDLTISNDYVNTEKGNSPKVTKASESVVTVPHGPSSDVFWDLTRIDREDLESLDPTANNNGSIYNDDQSFVSCMSAFSNAAPNEKPLNLKTPSVPPAGTASNLLRDSPQNLTAGKQVKNWIVTKGTMINGVRVLPRPPRFISEPRSSAGITMESKACQTEDLCHLRPNRIPGGKRKSKDI